MPETRYPCPDCGKVLKPARPVPAGKKIKCPECGAIFAVGAAPAAAPAHAKVAAAAKPSPAKAAPPPKPASRNDDDDEEGGGGTYTFVAEEQAQATEKKPKVHFGDIRDKFPKSKRGPALEAVVVPSRSMLYTGVILFLKGLIGACVSVWPLIFTDKFPPIPIVIVCIAWLVASLTVMGIASAIVHGAASMQNLESYGWSMTAAILCIICGISIPIGVWILIVLNKQLIKDGFEESRRNPTQ